MMVEECGLDFVLVNLVIYWFKDNENQNRFIFPKSLMADNIYNLIWSAKLKWCTVSVNFSISTKRSLSSDSCPHVL